MSNINEALIAAIASIAAFLAYLVRVWIKRTESDSQWIRTLHEDTRVAYEKNIELLDRTLSVMNESTSAILGMRDTLQSHINSSEKAYKEITRALQDICNVQRNSISVLERINGERGTKKIDK